MPNYAVPGVYIEEVKSGPSPIGAASTTTTAFLGVAPKANAHVNEPRPCNSWSDFVDQFVEDDSASTNLSLAVFGFYHNGGGRCYVVNLGKTGKLAGDARKGTGIHALESYDDIALIAAPGFTSVDDYKALADHAESMGNCLAILDGPATCDDVRKLTEVASTGDGEGAGGLRPETSDGGFAAFYYPWLRMRDPFGTENVDVPPSGHMAGIYVRTDTRRGVHKAPANMPIRTATGLTTRISKEQQGVLNPAGVNCIRFFSDTGIRVWGARTLADEASEWRYINVRRLFNMIEDSIAAGTRWTVFEPNDEILRKSVIRDVSAFLNLQWRASALVGATPAEAFFVKCDAENNPPESVNAGRLIIEVGIAPSRPAEFIVFRIGQWSGGVDIETE